MEVTKQSSSFFVMPFLFAPEQFAGRVQRIEAAVWHGAAAGRPVWQEKSFPVRELLPHLGGFVNPADRDTPATARVWALHNDALQSLEYGLGGGAGRTHVQWRLVRPHLEIEFGIEGVQLLLFLTGVGFLVVEARPRSAAAAAWLDFSHYFRFVAGEREVSVAAERKTAAGETTPFFPRPALAAGAQAGGPHVFAEVLNCLLATGGEAGEQGPWWRESYRPGLLLPYVSYFVQGVPEAELPELLYRVRNFYHAGMELCPDESQLRLDHPALLTYGRKQWFTFSLDGGAFVAADAPCTGFFDTSLPAHLRNEYLVVYLLALHQRFALLMLSAEVAQQWLYGTLASRRAAFERIHRRMLSLAARGYFAQVMQREHHHLCYTRWRQALQLDELFREVHDAIAEANTYLLNQHNLSVERLTERIGLLGVLLGLPALALTFLNINLRGITTRDDGMAVAWALVVALVAAAVAASIALLLKARSRERP